jgi:hypothetical protein
MTLKMASTQALLFPAKIGIRLCRPALAGQHNRPPLVIAVTLCGGPDGREDLAEYLADS